MSDLLLTKNKQKKFQEDISEVLSEAYQLEVSVRVESEGAVKIVDDSQYNILGKSESFEILKNTTLEHNSSSYKITLADDPNVAFQLVRDGW